MTPDEALIAQLQEAHGRATKGEWQWHWRADEDSPGSVLVMTDDASYAKAIAMCPKFGKQGFAGDAALIVLSHNALPRLIELAREALASRAVVEAAKARARWEKKPDDMRETVYGVLEAEAKAVLRNALLTLASATRKEGAGE